MLESVSMFNTKIDEAVAHLFITKLLLDAEVKEVKRLDDKLIVITVNGYAYGYYIAEKGDY